MPRSPRRFSSGRAYHLINRGVRRLPLFATDDDYVHFQQLMGAAQQRTPLRLLAYCLMPNHWHLVVWPEDPASVSAYMRWLTWSHACHFNTTHDLSGHVYQGRYRSIVVGDERHLLTLLRYVEGNPVRAGLVNRSETWRWSSLSSCPSIALCESPVRRPSGWLDLLAGSDSHEAQEVPGTVKDHNWP